MRDTAKVGMFESLHGGDSPGLVQAEQLLEQVHALAGHYTGGRGVSQAGASSETLTDLSQVRALAGLTESDFSLVPVCDHIVTNSRSIDSPLSSCLNFFASK